MRLVFKLDENSRRPVLALDWFKNCRALIDTGALFPVWTADEKILQLLGAIKLKEGVTFSGFGGKTRGTVYQVTFKLGKLTFVNMPIVASQMLNLNCHLILPATMFDDMTYEIDNVKHIFSVNTIDDRIVRVLDLSHERQNVSVCLTGTYATIDDYKHDSVTINGQHKKPSQMDIIS